jgi:hypothetical protein
VLAYKYRVVVNVLFVNVVWSAKWPQVGEKSPERGFP